MSGYRRLISYIYEYEGKVKGKNIGFVKLEAKNGQCRLNVNVKRVYMGGNAIGVYLLGKGGNKTFLGNMFVRNGTGEFRVTVDAVNVEGTGNPMDTYYGLTVHDVKNSWRSYQTIWDDVEIVEAAEVTGDEAKAENIVKAVDEEAAEGEIEVQPSSKTDLGMRFVAQDVLPGSDRNQENLDVDAIIKELDHEMSTQEAEPVEQSIETMVVSPELENPDVLRYLQETEQKAAAPDALWQELRKQYPKIQPFDYDGGCEVLAIRPDDIGKLPRECWIYGNNSFMLHGYYNYRYLILVRLNQADGTARYLLGVPGHYYSNEKYMATMFGFPNFVLSKKQPPNDGRFGYWYTDIKMR